MDEYLLFWFQVNNEQVAADPWKVERVLTRHMAGEPIHEVIKTARSEVPQLAEPACLKILTASRDAFGLPEVEQDGAGCTERTVMRIFNEYQAWRMELKKNTAGSPISRASTEEATEVGPSARKKSSDCGCSDPG